jgi:hypothetical protein
LGLGSRSKWQGTRLSASKVEKVWAGVCLKETAEPEATADLFAPLASRLLDRYGGGSMG